MILFKKNKNQNLKASLSYTVSSWLNSGCTAIPSQEEEVQEEEEGRKEEKENNKTLKSP